MIAFRLFAPGLIGLALLTAACRPQAAPSAPAALHIDQAWARTTPPSAKTGAGYLTIVNGDMPDRLLGVASPAAETVELHESAMEGMVMTMKPLDAQPLAAGETLALAPGAKHLMFVGLKAPFVSGATIPVTLKFEKAGDRTVDLVVRDAPPEAHDHRH